MRILVTLTFFLLCSCGDSEADRNFPPPIQAYPTQLNETNPAEPTTPAPSPMPSRRAHNYDAQDGMFYSYIAGLSENDIKAGKAAGDVFTFAYLGRRDDKHVLVRVLSTGRALGEVYCTDPCRIISYPDGTQIAFNEGSVIGAAFADALAGRLKVARYNQAPQPPPISSPTVTPAWSEDEASMISRWLDANEKCRGSSNLAVVADACANRDDVFGPALAAAGICYGRENEPASSSVMHRCERGSIDLEW